MDFENNGTIYSSGGAHQQTTTLYDILEIPADANRVQIRESFIRLKNTYANGSSALYSLVSEEDVAKNIAGLEEAYRVLSDDLLRKEYDEGLLRPKICVESELSCDDPFGENSLTIKKRGSEDEGDTELSAIYDQGTRSAAERPVVSGSKRKSATSHRYAKKALSDPIQDQIQERVDMGQFDGSLLKDLRDIQDVSLDELQERTKVSLQYIIALENNDFENLPSPVYVKGFLKICLQYLGLQQDLEKIVGKYLEFLKHWQENKTSSS